MILHLAITYVQYPWSNVSTIVRRDSNRTTQGFQRSIGKTPNRGSLLLNGGHFLVQNVRWSKTICNETKRSKAKQAKPVEALIYE
jgi:hypothetical protein